jgi:hypothetical protein
MTQIFANNAKTTLAAAVTTTGQTSITLTTGKGALFPNPTAPDYFMVTLDDGTNVEICKCTARATDVLTIARAQESTTAQASFAIGTNVEARLTSASVTNLVKSPVIQAVASPATITPDAANDAVLVSALANALTIANPTGTWFNFQKLTIRIKDNGTARALSFGANYRAVGLTLPTTTVINKNMYIGIIYNLNDSKWDVVSIAQE